MDFRAAEEDEGERGVPLAPMVDILFLLMVFLLSLYALSKAERQLTIALPHAESAGPIRRGLHDLLVNVRADGALILNGRQVSIEEFESTLDRLSSKFPADTVVVRADGGTPHRRFVSVLDACRKHGVKNVSVVTVPADGVGAPGEAGEGGAE